MTNTTTNRSTTKNTKALVAATAAVMVILVGAASAAIAFAPGWFGAAFVEKPKADARESALSDARQAAINLNSYDSANLDQSFDNIESSITGDLTDYVTATRDQYTQQIEQTGARTMAEVLGATLTSLDTDDGTADALVVLATTTTWPDQFSETWRKTMRLTMDEGDDGVWKVSEWVNLGNDVLLDQTPAQQPDPNAGSEEPGAGPEEPGPDAGGR
ncbi:mammalian cell entry protein [Rhodococcus spongiicola]|uniref:Mammalian cell entry protein n=1 Tax=Rhodococcus spongiicola TaxID=2487352 RepID=A0A3S3DZ17_9NOCA|nr:mammalian cell entry protein [Rhodococcus spongiicola]RVW01521.1 mammalian cell entry protein [Rhodococcus spongiicola]